MKNSLVTSSQLKSASKLLNDLIAGLERYEEVKPIEGGKTIFFQSGGKTAFSFRSRADQEKLAEAIDEIWNMNPDINRTVSTKTIREKIKTLITDKAEANIKITGNDIELLLAELISIEEREFSVLSAYPENTLLCVLTISFPTV